MRKSWAEILKILRGTMQAKACLIRYLHKLSLRIEKMESLALDFLKPYSRGYMHHIFFLSKSRRETLTLDRN